MYKFIKGLSIVLCIGFLCFMFWFMAYSTSHYQLEGIIEPTNNSNEYMFIDCRHNKWLFYADDNIVTKPTEGYCKFYDNMTTDYIKDDKIVDYQITDIDNNKPQTKISITISK